MSARGRSRRPARRVYPFGGGRAEGGAHLRAVLGGKGANLAEMSRLGLPVPPGFTLATGVCAEYERGGGRLPRGLRSEVLGALQRVERALEARFGDPSRPLLVSVRSGAPVSMPGMMDTILNLGLSDESVRGLARQADERFAWDSYRRFVHMFGDVVLGVPPERFEARLQARKDARDVELDTELSADDLRELCLEYREIAERHTGEPFPQDPEEQLFRAIAAVFRSWQNPRAVRYRRLHKIDDAGMGTAVNVQAMVFGNMGDDCATGVAFTRDPGTGERRFYGEYLPNAQGEDVVAGIRTPRPLRREDAGELPSLEETLPSCYRELEKVARRLERHYRDMQDIEFTIQHGRLWLLQTRAGKRTSRAAVRIAVEMARERLITRQEAVERVDPAALDQLLHPTVDPDAERSVVGRGLPASPGAAVGTAVFDADEAEARARAGEKVILVRAETSPDDVHGMHAAEGILTARGGMTSHAAVVARGMGKCCVVGCRDLRFRPEEGTVAIGDRPLRRGDAITLDGGTGEVMWGRVPTVTPELGGSFSELMRWADRFRRLRVRTNADTAHDAKLARQFGAEGIGLCRTEHMFFEPDRILAMRQTILADDREERERAIAKLLPMQRADFAEIFRAMEGLPVTIRLLDPPLHEFLPHDEEGVQELADSLDLAPAEVRAKLAALREYNPMLGHRGCRLGITFPEIYRMQVRAIAQAAREVAESGIRVRPEIMIPLVSHERELEKLRALVLEETRAASGRRARTLVGTMIEIPRAALTAEAIATHADFFSFGTNDLTQMAYGLSRDDANKFLPAYVEGGILRDDPFVSIDEEGIGALVRIGVEGGRRTRPGLKVGICGEHGGDPQSVRFFARLGLDYVSCSPFRVPVARLAAAQAALAAPSAPRAPRRTRGAAPKKTRGRR